MERLGNLLADSLADCVCHRRAVQKRGPLSRRPDFNLSEPRPLVVVQVRGHQEEAEPEVVAHRFDDAGANGVVHLHDGFLALAHAEDFGEVAAVEPDAEVAFAVVRHRDGFAGIAADIRVACGKFHGVAVDLQAHFVGAGVGHREHAPHLVQELGRVHLHGALEVLRNHGAVVGIRALEQLRDDLRGTGVEEDVRGRRADFDGRVGLRHVEDKLECLLRDDGAVREVRTFLVDAGTAQTVAVGRDHRDGAVLRFEVHAVQVQADGVGRAGEGRLLGEEREFAGREAQRFAFGNFGERGEVAGVETGDGGLAAFAPLDGGEEVLHVDGDGRDARVDEALDEFEQLARVDDHGTVAFTLDFDLDPDTEVQVRRAHFEEVAFEAEGEVVEDLDGGLVGDGVDGCLQYILECGFFNDELHFLSTSLDNSRSDEEYDCDSGQSHDNPFVHRITFLWHVIFGVLFCAPTFASTHVVSPLILTVKNYYFLGE